ncbi:MULTISPECIES: hypothetical protein [Paenibacillus]|nr:MULTISPECIES: hypothetical protein [Paenibacillus]MDH6430735.1 hypothetical protein [Paenibacillus sp. PastH-4]MDH6446570.1 hypothetical protein [Paenibacillus sp. PastF-4]MDH6530972.1 hypothetical protein [Paenibacillus sp. PastH-3]
MNSVVYRTHAFLLCLMGQFIEGAYLRLLGSSVTINHKQPCFRPLPSY